MGRFFPESLDDIPAWACANRTTPAAARLRFIRFCVLESVASEPRLANILILRGSAALQLFYGVRRESNDNDLVVLNIDGGPICGEGVGSPKALLNAALGRRLPLHFGGVEAGGEWVH